jgi:hypothetical protein
VLDLVLLLVPDLVLGLVQILVPDRVQRPAQLLVQMLKHAIAREIVESKVVRTKSDNETTATVGYITFRRFHDGPLVGSSGFDIRSHT